MLNQHRISPYGLTGNRILPIGILLAAAFMLASPRLPAASSSPTPSRVLVVYNANWTGDGDGDGVQDSLQVANYYMLKRGVPAANILGLSCSTGSGGGYGTYIDFYNEVAAPIKSKLGALGTTNIDIVLFCYGVPYQLPKGTSVDNAIMSINFLSPTDDNTNWYTNRYFATAPTFQPDFGHFDHSAFKDQGGNDMYLVTRLDGPRGVQGVLELVDQALYAERYVSPQAGYYNGYAYVDSRNAQPNGVQYTDAYLAASSAVQTGDYGDYGSADYNMAYAEHYVAQSGFTLKWENTNGPQTSIGDPGATYSDGTSGLVAPRALFYGGWYNYGRYNDVWSWLPGSVACDLDSNSLDNRSVRTLGDATGFGIEALRNGATCVSGVLGEPYLTGNPRPNVLLYYMLKGYTFAEASTLANPAIGGWMPINIGDPLYAPMKSKTLLKDTQSPAIANGFPTNAPGTTPSERTIRIVVSDSPEPEVAQVKIEYGLNTSYGSTMLSGEGFWRRHTILLSNLVPNSIYHYRVTLTDPVGNVTVSGDQTFSTAVVMLGGFEAPNVGPGGQSSSFQSNPTGSPWTFEGQSGISGNGSWYTQYNDSAPEGAQVAFLQNHGVFWQSIGGFQAGASYTFVFTAAQRNYSYTQDFEVFLDTAPIGHFTPSGMYSSYRTSTISPGAGSHVLKFVGLNTPAQFDVTAFIDNVLMFSTSAGQPGRPAIGSSSSASGTVGAPFNFTVTASNGPTSFNATGLPAGLSIDTSTGVISGTPSTAGISNVSLSATNAGGTGTGTLTLTIVAAQPPAPEISSASTASGTAGAAFSFSIIASNNPTSFNAAGLPDGLSIDTTTGVISGTPSTAGMSNISLSATNAGGTGTGSLALTIVAAKPPAPEIGSASTASGTVGAAFSFAIIASNNPTSFNATGLPDGLSIDTSAGVISGTPSAAGASNISLSATNAGGTGTAALALTINIAGPNLGFENPAVGPADQYGSFQYTPSGASWTFLGQSGISANGSGFTSGNPGAPEGAQVAVLQNVGSFSQSLGGFEEGRSYSISFAAAQRGNYGGTQDFQVFLDNTLLGTYTPSGTAYADITTAPVIPGAGSHTLKFAGLNSAGGDDTVFIDNVRIVKNNIAAPYGGIPWAIPGIIQAEDYDLGGENIGYFDTTGGNSGGQYRTDDVDIENCADIGGGFGVGWAVAGEWLQYTVNVGASGDYALSVRVASNGDGGTCHFECDGSIIGETLAIPNTGAWQNWTTLTTPVNLPAGQHILRLALDTNGSTGAVGNFNWFTFASASTTKARIFPRTGFGYRMVGGKFQGSNDNVNYTDLGTISSAPVEGIWTGIPLASVNYRYLRYLSPNGGWGNIAELEFYNGAAKLAGRGFGTAGSWSNAGSTFDMALDGNLDTFFDGPAGDGDFVGIDTGYAINTLPTLVSAAAAAPNFVAVNQTVLFFVAASDADGDTLTYTWNFGDGTTGAGAGTAHAYSSMGNYAATVTVNDGRGGTVSSSVSISVGNAINSGGGAVGAFGADRNFSGGSTYTATSPIAASGVANPAPQAVYQSERYGNFTYTISDLASGAPYTVRLHFAEIWWNSAGQRVFNVAINGTQVLSNFDIFAATGGKFIAIVKEFPATATNGQIVITYTTIKDNAKSSGIEIVSAAEFSGRAASALARDAIIDTDGAIRNIDLGTVKVGERFKIKLEAPESGAKARLDWKAVKIENLAPGVAAKSGVVGGRPRKPGTYIFDLQIKSGSNSTTNTYKLTVVP